MRPHYRLILVDARGHGASDTPHDSAAYDLPLRVGDVVAVLDALDVHTAHFWGYSMGGWIGFGLAKYAPERVRGLIVGGAHPYERRLPPSARLDGSDPKAFVEALLARLSVEFATLSPEKQAEFFANDFLALAAAQGDRPAMEDILPTMTMPCFLYSGEADSVLPDMQKCVQQMPHAIFMAFPTLNHPEAFYRADVVLPPVMKFLRSLGQWQLPHRSARSGGRANGDDDGLSGCVLHAELRRQRTAGSRCSPVGRRPPRSAICGAVLRR